MIRLDVWIARILPMLDGWQGVRVTTDLQEVCLRAVDAHSGTAPGISHARISL